jgi:hypothetical protein
MGRIGEFISKIGHHIKNNWPQIKSLVGNVVQKIFPGKNHNPPPRANEPRPIVEEFQENPHLYGPKPDTIYRPQYPYD